MAKLRLYSIVCCVESAQGIQSFAVRAEDEDDAIRRFHKGEAEFIDEEIEVTSLSEPEVMGEIKDEDE